jgi:hypothetical protein
LALAAHVVDKAAEVAEIVVVTAVAEAVEFVSVSFVVGALVVKASMVEDARVVTSAVVIGTPGHSAVQYPHLPTM